MKQENQFINILINIIIPTLILTKLSSETYLGPAGAVILAFSFPLAYAIWDYVKTRDINFFSVIGFISVLLTGGIALLELPPSYLAIKEAGIPFIIALTLFFFRTRFPFIQKLLHEILDTQKVYKALSPEQELTYQAKLRHANYGLIASFLLSSCLNYILATIIVTSQPGTEAYTQELGKLTALSYPFIAIPSMIVMMGAMVYVLYWLTKLTNIPMEDLLKGGTKSEKAD